MRREAYAEMDQGAPKQEGFMALFRDTSWTKADGTVRARSAYELARDLYDIDPDAPISVTQDAVTPGRRLTWTVRRAGRVVGQIERTE